MTTATQRNTAPASRPIIQLFQSVAVSSADSAAHQSSAATLKAMHRGRIIKRITIALGLGAIINVLVAWLPPARLSWIRRMERWSVAIEGTRALAWPTTPPATWPPAPDRVYEQTPGRGRARSFRIFMPVPEAQRSWQNEMVLYEMIAEWSGWPVRSMGRYTADVDGPAGSLSVDLGTLREGLSLGNTWQNRVLGTTHPLPLQPLWPGFAINTIFYGSLALGVLSMRSWEIRRRRRRRGLCILCEYPTTGLSRCPECGNAVASVTGSPEKTPDPPSSLTI